MFAHSFIQVQIKENTKALCHWPLWGESTGDRWIPLTMDQWCKKCFHLMTSSWTLQWCHNGHDGISNHQPNDCLLVYSGQTKSYASLAFVRGIHWWPVDSPHKGPVTQKNVWSILMGVCPSHVWCDSIMGSPCSQVGDSHLWGKADWDSSLPSLPLWLGRTPQAGHSHRSYTGTHRD